MQTRGTDLAARAECQSLRSAPHRHLPPGGRLKRPQREARPHQKQALIAQAVELTGYDRDYVRRLLGQGVPTKDPLQHRAGRNAPTV